MRNGQIEEAREIFKEIEESFPADSMAKSDISFTYLIKNDIENGKIYAQKACELDENNISALCNLAMIYNIGGEKESCEEICRKLSRIETDDAAEIFKIASTFCEIKRTIRRIYGWKIFKGRTDALHGYSLSLRLCRF